MTYRTGLMSLLSRSWFLVFLDMKMILNFFFIKCRHEIFRTWIGEWIQDNRGEKSMSTLTDERKEYMDKMFTIKKHPDMVTGMPEITCCNLAVYKKWTKNPISTKHFYYWQLRWKQRWDVSFPNHPNYRASLWKQFMILGSHT